MSRLCGGDSDVDYDHRKLDAFTAAQVLHVQWVQWANLVIGSLCVGPDTVCLCVDCPILAYVLGYVWIPHRT